MLLSKIAKHAPVVHIQAACPLRTSHTNIAMRSEKSYSRELSSLSFVSLIAARALHHILILYIAFDNIQEPPVTSKANITVTKKTQMFCPFWFNCWMFIPKMEVARLSGTYTNASIVTGLSLILHLGQRILVTLTYFHYGVSVLVCSHFDTDLPLWDSRI